MSSLADALVSKVLGHTAAERAFRPWWDNLEDYLVYALVMLGLIVLPTAIVNSTPLDCTWCQNGVPGCPSNYTETQDPNFNAWWVKKYCTFTAVDGFVLYFPYFLLAIALFIVLIERSFITMFKAGLKLDAFYNLLVSESLLEGAVSTSTDEKSQKVTKAAFLEMENSKLVVEVAQSFTQSSSYFWSYLVRTLAELAIASALFVWLCLVGLPTIENEEFILCSIAQHYFTCSGHPQRFYLYCLFLTIIILAIYILCCLYNLLWLFIPQLGSLSGVMRKYKKEFKKLNKQSKDQTDQEIFGDLYNLYYNNKDLKLLLDLLATSSGVAPCLRLLCLFDVKMREMAEVQKLQVHNNFKEEAERWDAIVKFDDPPIMKDIFSKIPGVTCTFTVEIAPTICENSIHALKYDSGSSNWSPRKLTARTLLGDGDTEMATLSSTDFTSRRTKFRNIDPKVEYTFRVCTLINGKTISKKLINLKEAENSDLQDA